MKYAVVNTFSEPYSALICSTHTSREAARRALGRQYREMSKFGGQPQLAVTAVTDENIRDGSILKSEMTEESEE